MPKRERSGALTIPARVVAPTRVNFGRLQTKTARLRSLVDDDVEPVIFHRRIEIFFDRRLQPVDFVDEKHIAFFQGGEQARRARRPSQSPGRWCS